MDSNIDALHDRIAALEDRVSRLEDRAERPAAAPIDNVVFGKRPLVCAHEKTWPSYKHSTCCACGWIKTDGDDDWGIAKNMWFADLEMANFYKRAGYLPVGVPPVADAAESEGGTPD